MTLADDSGYWMFTEELTLLWASSRAPLTMRLSTEVWWRQSQKPKSKRACPGESEGDDFRDIETRWRTGSWLYRVVLVRDVEQSRLADIPANRQFRS